MPNRNNGPQGGLAQPVWLVGHTAPLPVVLVNAADEATAQVLLTDEITGALVMLDVVHHEVHEGDTFQASYYSSSLANNASLDFALVVPANGRYPHVVWDAACGGSAEVQFHGSVTLTLPGTNLPARNLKRTSSKTATMAVYHTPSIANTGTQLRDVALPAGKGPQAPGGVERAGTEWILEPGKSYLIRLFNRSGNSQIASLAVQWYEEDED